MSTGERCGGGMLRPGTARETATSPPDPLSLAARMCDAQERGRTANLTPNRLDAHPTAGGSALRGGGLLEVDDPPPTHDQSLNKTIDWLKPWLVGVGRPLWRFTRTTGQTHPPLAMPTPHSAVLHGGLQDRHPLARVLVGTNMNPCKGWRLCSPRWRSVSFAPQPPVGTATPTHPIPILQAITRRCTTRKGGLYGYTPCTPCCSQRLLRLLVPMPTPFL